MEYGCQIINLPPLSTMVGKSTLNELRKCKEVILPEGLEEVGYAWFACGQVRKVFIPASVKRIKGYAFAECDELEEVVFGENSRLEAMGDHCFCDTKIREISIPHTLS